MERDLTESELLAWSQSQQELSRVFRPNEDMERIAQMVVELIKREAGNRL